MKDWFSSYFYHYINSTPFLCIIETSLPFLDDDQLLGSKYINFYFTSIFIYLNIIAYLTFFD